MMIVQTEKVDVLERIERDAPHEARRIIAQPACDHAGGLGRLVDDD